MIDNQVPVDPAIYIIYGISAIGIILVLFVIYQIFKDIYAFFKRAGEKLGTSPSGAFFAIIFLPITLPLGFLYRILRPYIKQLPFFVLGVYKIVIDKVAGIVQLGRQSVEDSSNPKTLYDQIESITVGAYRAYADRNNVPPTSKTSDQEIITMAKQVQNAFTGVAEQRGEHIPGSYLMTINVKFFYVFEKHGKDFFFEHLNYEVDKYLNEGLREDYKIDLGII